jgi:hypothetical protein
MSLAVRSLRFFGAGRRAQSSLWTLSHRRSLSQTALRAAQPATSTTASPAKFTPPQPEPESAESTAQPLKLQEEDPTHVDWTKSFHGLSTQPFGKEAADILQAPLDPNDIEIKPDGILYLPEIKYRRILNRAFGPGGWGLAPRGEAIITDKTVTREYALVAHGR